MSSSAKSGSNEGHGADSQRIDTAYTELHRSLRRQMFAQAGASAYGVPQQLTMADYSLSFSCIHDTTPIVFDLDFDLSARAACG